MALRKEPERRYQSVEQFSEDIRRHLEALPVLARQDTLAYRGAEIRTAQCGRDGRRGARLPEPARRHRDHDLAGAAGPRHRRRSRTQRRRARNGASTTCASWRTPCCSTTTTRSRTCPVRRPSVSGWSRTGSPTSTASPARPAAIRRCSANWPRLTNGWATCAGRRSRRESGRSGRSHGELLKALRIREALVAPNPQDVQARRDLARSYQEDRHPDCSRRAKQRAARSISARPSRCISSWSRNSRRSPEIRHELAALTTISGSRWRNWGDAAGALENQRKALALREEFVAAEPGNQKHRRNLVSRM